MVPSLYWKMKSGWTNHSDMVISYNMSENEMGYRGSKSVLPTKGKSVKEQRADGSWYIKNSPKKQNLVYLRCALTGYESSYQIKNPSKQWTKNFSTFCRVVEPIFCANDSIELRNILKASDKRKVKQLNPWFITGFTDAEGTFTVVITKDIKRKIGWRILPK
jgi:hypothetical protein